MASPPKLPRARQARGFATRAKLLRAAEDLFTRQGYEGASMSAVALRAGVGVGTLYHHFPDKHALLLELVDDWGERETRERGGDADFEAFLGEDARSAIAGMLRGAYDRLRRKPSLYLVVLSLADRDPDVQRRYQRVSRHSIERWRGLIAFGQRRGLFRADVDPAAAALLIRDVIDMAATQVLVRDLADPDPEQVLRELTNMICRHLLEDEK